MKFDDLGSNLVFIICTPRSGSTMLQHILGSHSKCYTKTDPWILLHLAYGLRNDNGKKSLGIEAEYDAIWANYNAQQFFAKLPDGMQVYYDAIRKAALHIFEKASEGTDKTHFILKSVRYYYIIPELFKIFPKAKFIFLFRNPLAQFTAVMRRWVKDGQWMSLRSFRRDFLEAPFYFAEARGQIKDNSLILYYEDMVMKPEETVNKITKALGIEFEPDMINYGDKIKNMTASEIAGLGDPSTMRKYSRPVTDFIDNWVELLNTSQKVYFAKQYLETLGRDIIEKIGYSYDDIKAKLDSLSYKKEEVYADWDLILREELTPQIVQQEMQKIGKVTSQQITKAKFENANSKIIGIWKVNHGIYLNYRYEFYADGTMFAEQPNYNIQLRGTYEIDYSVTPHHIDLHITEHSYGDAYFGSWLGIIEFENDDLIKLKFAEPNKPRWVDTYYYVYYYRQKID